MKTKNKISKLLVLIIIAMFSVSLVHAFDNNHYVNIYFNSVDDKEIRYDGNTQYWSEFNQAKNEWNNLDDKYVDILPDTWYTWEDLILKDVNRPDWENIPALYINGFWDDYIYFNKPFINKANSNQKKWIIAHEIGHALGLDHNPNKNNLMYKEYGVNYISEHDKYDYKYLWGPNGVGKD